MLISLVLATLGRSQEIKRLLDSIDIDGFELIVIDQNSDDRIEWVDCYAKLKGISYKRVKVDFKNLSAARNIGISLSAGKYIAFPDDDCWYEKGALNAAVDYLSSNGEIDIAIGSWPELEGIGEKVIDFPEYEKVRKFCFPNASSITLFVKSSCFYDVGVFNEKMGVGQVYGSGEETEFLMRASKFGKRIIKNPAIVIHHKYDKDRFHSLSELPNAFNRSKGTGAIYSLHWPGLFYFIKFIISPIVKAGLNLSIFGILSGCFVSAGRFFGYIKARFDADLP